jgi:hypothetical protein
VALQSQEESEEDLLTAQLWRTNLLVRGIELEWVTPERVRELIELRRLAKRLVCDMHSDSHLQTFLDLV